MIILRWVKAKVRLGQTTDGEMAVSVSAQAVRDAAGTAEVGAHTSRAVVRLTDGERCIPVHTSVAALHLLQILSVACVSLTARDIATPLSTARSKSSQRATRHESQRQFTARDAATTLSRASLSNRIVACSANLARTQIIAVSESSAL